MSGIGIKGIGYIPIVRKGGSFGMPPWDFDPNLITFTAGMAKRATSVFAAAPIVQGKRDNIGLMSDSLTWPRGTSPVAGAYFYPNSDTNQGSICFRITPEWNGNDGQSHGILNINELGIWIYKYSDNLLYMAAAGGASVNITGWVAGTTYNITVRWDSNNTLDGTNYTCISINDVHTFGSKVTLSSPDATQGLMLPVAGWYINAIIEGLTIYRRVLYDGTYGVNVGNGDEVALIAAGVDPTTVTGSWDVCFCLPTNATAGALVTGTGEAWSHPHSSNLLTRGFLSDRYYGDTNQWGVKFNGTSTTINCGSDAGLDNLHDGAMTIEGWFLHKASTKYYMSKYPGWYIGAGASSYLPVLINCATTSAYTNALVPGQDDGKWHHIAVTWDDAGDRIARLYFDGRYIIGTNAGVGAVVDDSAVNFTIGSSPASTYNMDGAVGWCRISNNIRYTTDFLPARTPPAVDGNTIAQWNMTEGTGVTVDNAEGTAARDGTITAGVWEPQWYDEGTPVRLRSVVGSATYRAVITSAAEISDLQDAAFTVDGWVRIDKSATLRYLFYKGTLGTNGWQFNVTTGGLLNGVIQCVTTDATSTSTARIDDGYWHYVKMTFDDAGDRKIDLFVDNVEVTYSVETAGNGAIVSDAGVDAVIGHATTGLLGAHSWLRLSDVVRGAGMIPRSNPPDPADADTMGQWNADEGALAVLTDLSGEGNNGAMAGTYSWNNSPAMESDSPGARNYAWGYNFGVTGSSQGFKQTLTGLVTGSNYILNASTYSEDGLAQPLLVVRDETGSADLITLLGTVASTEKVPDVLSTAFKLPGLCTSISVKLLNSPATGTVGWHQALLYANLWQDPGFEIGTPPDLVGTPTGSSQSNEQAHSGGYSWKVISDAVDEGISRSITVTNGNFYHVSGWVYASASGTIDLQISGGAFQDGITTVKTSSGAGAWKRLAIVVRATSTTLVVKFMSNAAQTFYVDDVAVF